MFKQTKECSGSFSCRFKVVLSVAVLILAAAVLFIIFFGKPEAV